VLSASRSVIAAPAPAPKSPHGYAGTHAKESQADDQNYSGKARATGEGELRESGGARHLALRLRKQLDACLVGVLVVGVLVVVRVDGVAAVTVHPIYDAVLGDVVLKDIPLPKDLSAIVASTVAILVVFIVIVTVTISTVYARGAQDLKLIRRIQWPYEVTGIVRNELNVLIRTVKGHYRHFFASTAYLCVHIVSNYGCRHCPCVRSRNYLEPYYRTLFDVTVCRIDCDGAYVIVSTSSFYCHLLPHQIS
jgi:hypothetical protein